MRTRTCFWLRILPVIVCACSGSLFCQDPLDYVPNLPYTAVLEQEYVEVEADGSHVQRQRKLVRMRDSQGRTRIENFPPEDRNCCAGDGQADVVNLYVPLQRQFIQLFPGRRTASLTSFSGTEPIPRHFGPNDKNAKREILPGKTIAGIYTEDTRVTFFIPHDGRTPEVGCVIETWVSPDMKIAVLTKYGGTCGDGGITELRELDRNEPDAALFEIPKGYTIVTAR